MVSLWDLMSLIVGSATAGGGLAALSLYHASGLREVTGGAILAGAAVASVLAVRTAGDEIRRRTDDPRSGPRVVRPYAVELAGIVILPMLAFFLVRFVLVGG